MNVIFFGTADFAVPALEALHSSVVLVVTQPDRPSGRGLELRASPVKKRALELGLQVENPVKSRSPEFIDRIRALDADVLVVAAYGQILSPAMLESAKRGAVNLHGSILPKYRGAAPIQRAILNGDEVTGVTLMQMNAGMDTGDVIAIQETPIGHDETAGDIFTRLSRIAAHMASEWMPRICDGDYQRTPQDDSKAVMAPKVERDETRLEFTRAAKREYDRFRAFTPFPGAFLETNKGRIKIEGARLAASTTEEVGIVSATKPDLVVSFANGAMTLLQVRPEGKKAMTGADWANGARVLMGDCLLR